MKDDHSHARSDYLFETLPKQSNETINSSKSYLEKVIDVKPNYQTIHSQLSTDNNVIKRRDWYNFRDQVQKSKNPAPVDSNDLTQMIKEMLQIEEATVKVFHNENNELQAVYFQDRRMKHEL